MTGTFTAPVEILDGKWRMNPLTSEQMRRWLISVKKDKVWMTLDAKLPKRSTQQNNFYWGAVLPHISAETGDVVEDLHDLFKSRFLKGAEKEIRGHKVQTYKSTTSLSVGEFAEYLFKIEQWTGIPLPSPEDARYISNYGH